MPNLIDDVQLAAERLRQGGLVAFPTETVYGLGADAMNEAAVAAVFALKGRPSRNPLIVHVSGPEMARRVVADGAWSDAAEALARHFWPGPLSFILPKARNIPSIVTAGGDTVAVRCPFHPFALALLFEFEGPLVGPSANPSGSISPTAAEHVREAFPGADLLVLDGGRCTGGIESTVVSLVDPARPAVLRPGLISAKEIGAVLGCAVIDASAATDNGGTLASPGLLARHYAPRTPASLFAAHEWPRVLVEHPGRAAVLSHEMRLVESPHLMIAMPPNPEEYAAALYAALREADAAGVQRILIERPPEDHPVWRAIADRLRRATTPE